MQSLSIYNKNPNKLQKWAYALLFVTSCRVRMVDNTFQLRNIEDKNQKKQKLTISFLKVEIWLQGHGSMDKVVSIQILTRS